MEQRNNMKKLKTTHKLRNLIFASAAATGISFFGGFLAGKYNSKDNSKKIEQQDTVLIALPNPNQQQIEDLKETYFSSFSTSYKAYPLPSSKIFLQKSQNKLKIHTLKDIISAKEEAKNNIIAAQSSQDTLKIFKACYDYQQVLSSGLALIKYHNPQITNFTNLNSMQLNAKIYSTKSFIQTCIKAGIFDNERRHKEESLYLGLVLIRDYNTHRKQYNEFYKLARQTHTQDSLSFEKAKQKRIDSLQNTPIIYEEFYTKHKKIIKQSSR